MSNFLNMAVRNEKIYLNKFSSKRYGVFLLIEKIYKKFINSEDHRLDIIIEKITQTQPLSILEIGSGTFPIYAHLPKSLKQKCSYYISEINPEKVMFLKEIYKGKIDVVKADALLLPYRDSFFDFVLSKGVLHHIDDNNSDQRKQKRLRFLGEIKRVLKKRGVGLIMDFNYNTRQSKSLFWHFLHRIILMEGEHYFSNRTEVETLFKIVGYKNIQSGEFDTFKGLYFYVTAKK